MDISSCRFSLLHAAAYRLLRRLARPCCCLLHAAPLLCGHVSSGCCLCCRLHASAAAELVLADPWGLCAAHNSFSS
jgi:hypothetical protein